MPSNTPLFGQQPSNIEKMVYAKAQMMDGIKLNSRIKKPHNTNAYVGHGQT